VASRVSQEIARQTLEAKLNYWNTVLSDDGMFWTLGSTVDMFDWLRFYAEFTMFDTLFSSLALSFNLDIPLDLIVPVNILFRVELPTLEEFLRGVLIKLIPIELKDLVPELANVILNPLLLLEDEIRQAMEETRLEKCRYNISKYGRCYVDPTAFRELLRSTMLAFTKKAYDWVTTREMLLASAKALNVNPELVRDFYNRFSMITHVKLECGAVNYSWVGMSRVCKPEITFRDFEQKLGVVYARDMFDLQAGCVVGYSRVDYCYATGGSPGVHPYKPGLITRIQEALSANFRDRILTTALAVGNYQTPEERASPLASRRTEVYAIPYSQKVHLEQVVATMVQELEPDVNGYTLRLYQDAALDLYGSLGSPHRWGFEMHRAMTLEELQTFWLEKWGALGLKREVLEMIWDKVMLLVGAYTSVRVKVRVRELRRRFGVV